WVRSSAPRSQDRTPASATPRDPSLATNYRGSGLVLRRVSLFPVRPDEGRLTEPTTAVQPWQREPLFVPPKLSFLPRSRLSRSGGNDGACRGVALHTAARRPVVRPVRGHRRPPGGDSSCLRKTSCEQCHPEARSERISARGGSDGAFCPRGRRY